MVSTDQGTILADDWTDWDEKFTRYTTPDDHNTASISDINSAYEAYAPQAETVRVGIRDNTAIVLNGTDQVNLDIKPVSKSRAIVPAKDFAPSIGLIRNISLLLEIFVFDPSFPSKKAKPPGAKFIGSMVAFTDVAGTAPALDAYSTRVPEGKTTIEILYSLDKVGKKMWVICWYMSPTGKPSPLSVPFSVVLV